MSSPDGSDGRRDPRFSLTSSREAAATVAAQRLLGRELLTACRLVADHNDAAVWRAGREAWTEAALITVREFFPTEVADEFRRTSEASQRGEWREVFDAEARAVADALDLISALLAGMGRAA